MSDIHIKELGEDQWKWLNKYKSINLHHWRVQPKVGWIYVGEWEPEPGNMGESYSKRRKNIENNKYFYWPS